MMGELFENFVIKRTLIGKCWVMFGENGTKKDRTW